MRHGWLAWCVVVVSGCMPSAAVHWSPDGRRAVYVVCRHDMTNFIADGLVIDPTGKTIADLGVINPSWEIAGLSSVAWTDDGRAVWFAAAADPVDRAEPSLARDWAAGKPMTTQPAEQTDGGTYKVDAVVSVWNRTETKAVARLPRRMVVDLKLSPDGLWVAVTAMRPGMQSRVELFAVATRSGHLYRADNDVVGNVCFTGPHRMAFVKKRADGGETQLVEAIPDELNDKLDEQVAIEQLPNGAEYLTPLKGADGILFLAAPGANKDIFAPGRLCRWDRAGKVTKLADDVATVAASPDQKTLMCLMRHGDMTTVELLDADGTRPRLVCPIDPAKLPVMPAWHGNDRVTLFDGPGVAGDNGSELFELVDRPVGSDGKLGPPVKLSDGWDPARKPWFVKREGVQ